MVQGDIAGPRLGQPGCRQGVAGLTCADHPLHRHGPGSAARHSRPAPTAGGPAACPTGGQNTSGGHGCQRWPAHFRHGPASARSSHRVPRPTATSPLDEPHYPAHCTPLRTPPQRRFAGRVPRVGPWAGGPPPRTGWPGGVNHIGDRGTGPPGPEGDINAPSSRPYAGSSPQPSSLRPTRVIDPDASSRVTDGTTLLPADR